MYNLCMYNAYNTKREKKFDKTTKTLTKGNSQQTNKCHLIRSFGCTVQKKQIHTLTKVQKENEIKRTKTMETSKYDQNPWLFSFNDY